VPHPFAFFVKGWDSIDLSQPSFVQPHLAYRAVILTTNGRKNLNDASGIVMYTYDNKDIGVY
jgi:hypothetical protein